MAIDMNTFIVRDNEMMFTSMDNEIVVLNMAQNNYVGLDEIGSRIWEMVQAPMRVGDLCHLLWQEYDASAEQIETGVLAFLAELKSEGMIRLVTAHGDTAA
jgi:hypothetical protein